MSKKHLLNEIKMISEALSDSGYSTFRNLFKTTQDSFYPGKFTAHYTTLSNFYSIVDTDGLWATQARFSNDGLELKNTPNSSTSNRIPDCYVVSLTLDEDILSQWRGYCFDKEGVSVSFDLSTYRPVYLSHGGEQSQSFYLVGQPVIYGEMTAEIGEHLDTSENRFISLENSCSILKHNSFHEEKEIRLVVTNKNRELENCIRYRQSGNLQVPFVELKMGNPENQNKKAIVRVNAEQSVCSEVNAAVKPIAKIVFCRAEEKAHKCYDDHDCFGCTMRSIKPSSCYPKESECRYLEVGSLISNENNVVMISEGVNQKEIFVEVAKVVDVLNEQDLYKKNKIKVWCEGHLPIRKIRVGNTRRLDELHEAIKHFCEFGEHYWLRYVDVDPTNIPYRSRLEFK